MNWWPTDSWLLIINKKKLWATSLGGHETLYFIDRMAVFGGPQLWQKSSASWATAKCRIIFEECRGVGFEACLDGCPVLIALFRWTKHVQICIHHTIEYARQTVYSNCKVQSKFGEGSKLQPRSKDLGAYFMQVQSFLKLRVRIVNCSPNFKKM